MQMLKLIAFTLHSGILKRSVYARIKHGTNASTSVTSEFKKRNCGIFAKTGQKHWAKIGISHQISQQLLNPSLLKFYRW